MLHAHVPTVEKKFRVKVAKCHGCGAELEYITKPPIWCDPCNPNGYTRLQHRILASERRPGFCSACNVIRLSAADTDGTCTECKADK